MEDISLVEKWLLEYACHRQMSNILKYYSSLTPTDITKSSNFDSYGIHTLRFAVCALTDIVNQEHVAQFELALNIVSEIYEKCGAGMISYAQFVKLSSRLKILHLFHMLENGDKLVLPQINEYFPREGLNHPCAAKKLQQKINYAQKQFRKFFLPLIVNKRARDAYLQDEFNEEFGPEFMQQIKNTTKDFIEKVEKGLPTPLIIKLQEEEENNSELRQHLTALQSPAIEILLDVLHENNGVLSEEAIKEISCLLRPEISSQRSKLNLRRGLALEDTSFSGSLTSPETRREDDTNQTRAMYGKVKNKLLVANKSAAEGSDKDSQMQPGKVYRMKNKTFIIENDQGKNGPYNSKRLRMSEGKKIHFNDSSTIGNISHDSQKNSSKGTNSTSEHSSMFIISSSTSTSNQSESILLTSRKYNSVECENMEELQLENTQEGVPKAGNISNLVRVEARETLKKCEFDREEELQQSESDVIYRTESDGNDGNYFGKMSNGNTNTEEAITYTQGFIVSMDETIGFSVCDKRIAKEIDTGDITSPIKISLTNEKKPHSSSGRTETSISSTQVQVMMENYISPQVTQENNFMSTSSLDSSLKEISRKRFSNEKLETDLPKRAEHSKRTESKQKLIEHEQESISDDDCLDISICQQENIHRSLKNANNFTNKNKKHNQREDSSKNKNVPSRDSLPYSHSHRDYNSVKDSTRSVNRTKNKEKQRMNYKEMEEDSESSGTYISDSENQDTCSNVEVIPSSYSNILYDSISGEVNDVKREAIPELGKHLKSVYSKPCVVKLHKSKIFGEYTLYS